MKTFRNLYDANEARQRIWDPNDKLDYMYHAVELGGEAGEALNKIKKRRREELGLRGTRVSISEIMEELADTVICAYLVAGKLDLDLTPFIAKKFNETSEKYGLPVMMEYIREDT